MLLIPLSPSLWHAAHHSFFFSLALRIWHSCLQCGSAPTGSPIIPLRLLNNLVVKTCYMKTQMWSHLGISADLSAAHLHWERTKYLSQNISDTSKDEGSISVPPFLSLDFNRHWRAARVQWSHQIAKCKEPNLRGNQDHSNINVLSLRDVLV